MCEEMASQEFAKLKGKEVLGGWCQGGRVGSSGYLVGARGEGDWETKVSTTLDNLKGVAVLEGYVAVNFHLFLLFNVKSPPSRSPMPRFTFFIIILD